ncbi:MAG: hypothetical protein A2504_17020 [Bdellovibrionales bacterium RIFOXYD12_FULL_39_22]|nr:MAG: hypothetical protein A2385_17845 [Bdellovibrionales bacterium RIFOXYB1_FULL_39_21]OFZ44036.1 MAG: hypothetical protein A2485_14980 [Bdellovibrionales bacterium RIFOXYC12_FULL_39_17]OFZ48289.1 MAG: hypothetical protein A2404_08710 [Bdellovibrionales bacterium RIFOXYC1_FULL_39_130]OFZ76617.1 MAG: hypothetical protein A2560_17790 [Bdellovibrionales bacterium RIFOXYD1_FULL_39_84]OFZ76966.1 MAG: hypothetical protein A2451_11290 [Bdellovibrionales bacterium RIFOXYC2_FULL_39_8]OFZ95538.1 MAG:
MIYYIFKNQIFSIFLSMAHLTAITFPERITDYVGGTEGDFKIYELNKRQSLVFEPKRKEIDCNFILFEKDAKYYFNIKYSDELASQDIEIKEAQTCSLYSLIADKKDYQLFDCPRSILFVNKSKAKVKVNDQEFLDRAFLSKGPPIFLNGKLIYYRGIIYD